MLDVEAPIFIGGMPKSGTTLLRAMLCQHSRICGGLETHWYDPDKAHCFWAPQIKGGGLGWLKDRMLMLAFDTGKPRWCEKTTGNVLLENLEQIYNRWPKAQVIQMVRSPISVFCSLERAGKGMSTQEFIESWGRYVIEPYRLCSHHVRYEQLVQAPAYVMRELLLALGEEYEPQCAVWAGDGGVERRTVMEQCNHDSSTLKALAEPLHGLITEQEECGEGTRRVIRDKCPCPF